MVVVTNLVDFETGLHSRVLDANLGSSWSHRATAATLAAGVAVSVIGTGRARQSRLAWSASAVALLLLFGAEVSAVHVEVDRLSYGKLVYLPVLVALALGVRKLTTVSPAGALARVGLLTLAGAYAIHLFGRDVLETLGWGTGSWVYQVKVGLKEGVELAGWLLVVLALWRVAQWEPQRGGARGRCGEPCEHRAPADQQT